MGSLTSPHARGSCQFSRSGLIWPGRSQAFGPPYLQIYVLIVPLPLLSKTHGSPAADEATLRLTRQLGENAQRSYGFLVRGLKHIAEVAVAMNDESKSASRWLSAVSVCESYGSPLCHMASS